MDSSYFSISNATSTPNQSNLNDFEQSSSSSSFNYDPFDGFPFLDQQSMRLYDYFGTNGRISPPISQYPSIDQLDQHHIHQQQNTLKNTFPFQTDPNQEDDDDLQGTLTSFVADLGGVDGEAGYTSSVDLFSTTNIVDCLDSTEAYYLRLALEQNNNININNINGFGGSCSNSSSSSASIDNNQYSDINNNSINNYNSNNNINEDHEYINCNNISGINSYKNNSSCNDGDSNTSQKAKRSVLMNLLIDGSDVGAGYTSHTCRALPQRIIQQQQRHQQAINIR